jgi:hypothetical protein
MANRPDHGHFLPLPKGSARTANTNGGHIVRDYSKKPIDDTFNPDKGQRRPQDPFQKLDPGKK